MKRTITLVSALALAAVTAGCGSSSGSSGSSSKGDYNLLAILPTSGATKLLGGGYVAAINLAVEDINASGGINGRKVKVTVKDDQSNPNQAVTVLQSEISGGHKPDAVYAGATSNEALAMLPVLSSAKIINIGITNSAAINNPAKFPYTFRPDPVTAPYGDYLAKTLAGKGYKRIGIVGANDALSKDLLGTYKSKMEAAGLTAFTGTFELTDLDLSATLEKVKAQSPDAVVFTSALPATNALVLKARAKVGMTQPFYGDIAVNGNLAGLIPAGAGKDVSIAGYALNFPDGTSEAVRSFQTRLKTAFGTPTNFLIGYVWPYDAVKLLQAGAKQAGSTDAEKMKEALENLQAQPAGTFLGFQNYKFSATSHFNTAVTDADYAIHPLGPLVDGQFTASN